MKKTVLILIATLVCAMFAFGQESIFKKGDILVSGTTGASFSSNSLKPDAEGAEKFTVNHFALNGAAGYFINERIAVGGILAYMNIGLDGKGMPADKVSLLGLNAFGRYYVAPPSGTSSLGFYGQLNLGINKMSAGDKIKASGPAYGGAAGINYFISENVSLDCSLNYTLTSIKIKDMEHKMKGSTLNFLVGVSIKL